MINIKKLHSCDSHFFKQLILDEDAYFEDFKNLGWSEDQINSQLKSKINLSSKEIDTKEAEKIIAEFNKPNIGNEKSKTTSLTKNKTKSKKISKK